MQNRLYFLMMIFVIIKSQEYKITLVLEENQYLINYNNLNSINDFLCRENIICEKIIIITYYCSCVYIITIIIRSIFVLFILIMCLIND